jgi:phosphoribosylamine--glycine ligase
MGAYSPAPFVDEKLNQKIIDQVILPTVAGMISEGVPYRGFLYAGLMISKHNEPKVLEYNCRFGDPETQPIMMRLTSDLFEMIESCFDGTIASHPIEWDQRPALGVVMASSGYPESYATGFRINGIDEMDLFNPDIKIFHSGTTIDNNQVITHGGRVLCVTALGNNIKESKKQAYKAVKNITWGSEYYRKDIGDKAIKRLN